MIYHCTLFYVHLSKSVVTLFDKKLPNAKQIKLLVCVLRSLLHLNDFSNT